MLPNSGTCNYNGVAWESLYKSKVECKPVKDSASRALVAREYTLEIEGHLAAPAGGTTDETMTALRMALERPAGPLLYNNKGFGNLNVNTPGGVKDCAYGPWPDVLAWTPIGNDQGCAVRWRCVVVLPCEEVPKDKGIIEYCWTEAWDIDADGYTVRTIDGHLTVQATRQLPNDRTIPDNADAYLDKVVPDLPVGFRRTQQRKLSEDKRTLDFTFKDEEIPQPLPSNVTAADVRHKVAWKLPRNGEKPMTSSISGTLTLGAGIDKRYIWDKIILILRSRWPVGGAHPGAIRAPQALAVGLDAALAAVAGQPPPPPPPINNVTYLLTGIEIDDDVFGKSSSFSATCWILGANCSRPSYLLTYSNLWAPVGDSSFVRWKKSIFAPNGKPMSPRGMAAMSFQNGDDALVDLCSEAEIPAVLSGQVGIPRELKGGMLPQNPLLKGIDPKNTWLEYRLRLRLVEDDRVVRHKPLGGKGKVRNPPIEQGVATSKYPTSPGLKPPSNGEIGGFITKPGAGVEKLQGQGPGVESGIPDMLQRVSAPTYTIRLEGHAVRLGYPIPTPRLATVGGVAVTQLRQNVSQEQVSAIGGVPIYGATFWVEYALPQDPKVELPMPVNPAIQ